MKRYDAIDHGRGLPRHALSATDLPVDALLLPPVIPALSGFNLRHRRLAEHSAMALQQSGITRILTLPGVSLERGAAGRLAAAGIEVTVAGNRALETLRPHRGLIALSVDVFFDPRAIEALFDRMAALSLGAAAVAESSPGTFVGVSAITLDEWRHLDGPALVARMGALRVCHLGESLSSVALSVTQARIAHRHYPLRAARRWGGGGANRPGGARDRLSVSVLSRQ